MLKILLQKSFPDEAAYRSWIRNVTFRKGVMSSAVKDEEKDEKIYMKCITIMKSRCRKSCRIVLAMNRGEKEDILRVSVVPPVDEIVTFLYKKVIRDNGSKSAQYVKLAIEDGYKRLIQPLLKGDSKRINRNS